MADNRGVAYIKPGVVEVQSIDFPKLYDPSLKKKVEHGVILKIISTNICGSDQHMVRGRTATTSATRGKSSAAACATGARWGWPASTTGRSPACTCA